MKFIRFIKNIKTTIFFLFLSFCLTHYSNALLNDEIDFFNVGQGHAVLINKVGAQAPLLIDAGSKSHPTKIGTRYKWEDQDRESLSLQISNRILDVWKASNNGNLWGKQFFLNVIVTHPDEDHKDLVPLILTQLEKKVLAAQSSFNPYFLLGGTNILHYCKDPLYLDFLKKYEKNIIYSEQYQNIYYKGALGFLETSDCITHLFCPQGTQENTSTARNRWSIVIRIKVKEMTALIAGDADTYVKESMLQSMYTTLEDRRGKLESDILLAPHHGAEGNYCVEWDERVNPRAIIIGAALMHKHPKGRTLIEFLNLKEGKGRLWQDRVMPHGIQYYCDANEQQQIETSFSQKEDRLFDKVPNITLINQGAGTSKQWNLAWIDLPIYTLWTTGSLYFDGDVLAPKFVDTPHGLMGYIAVPDPKYLLNPYIRGKLVPLIPTEKNLQERILPLITTQRGNEEGAQYGNMVMKEALLVEEHQDRSHYLNTLIRVFSETRPHLYRKTNSFKTLREAIVGRNKKVDRHDERVQEAVNFIFRSVDALVQQNDSDLILPLYSGGLDNNVIVLKTFLKSIHKTDKLKEYVKLGFKIPHEEEDLCPFGYPEWVQLGKLMDFFYNEILEPTQEGISIYDIVDLSLLRNQGKNFKEIAQAIIEEENFLKIHIDLVRFHLGDDTFTTTKESFYEKLEQYFPRVLDEFLS